ncbi:MAG: hypothetical protein KDK12_20490 [Rhodobacteraceae bacterium]|nr:hypothetical protein [Paracoccaceae bacterium]
MTPIQPPAPSDADDDVESRLARRDAALSDMARRLAAAEEAGRDLRAVLAVRTGELAALTRLLEEDRARAPAPALVEALQRERDEAVAELVALRASTSWRITAPLRRLVLALRGKG